MSGKKGVAPCGCPGTYATVNYVTCDNGCDSTAKPEPEEDETDFRLVIDDEDLFPDYIDPEKTAPLCARCGSDKVQLIPGFTFSGRSYYHCDGCNRDFYS